MLKLKVGTYKGINSITNKPEYFIINHHPYSNEEIVNKCYDIEYLAALPPIGYRFTVLKTGDKLEEGETYYLDLSTASFGKLEWEKGGLSKKESCHSGIEYNYLYAVKPIKQKTPKPFGYSYLIDCYEAKDLDNMEKMYRFLETLVDKLDMKLAGNISVIHGPVAFEAGQPIELYSEKAGLTAFAPLITSAIVCHTVFPRNFLTLDVYSCKEFDPNTVRQFTLDTYLFERFEDNFIIRGKNY